MTRFLILAAILLTAGCATTPTCNMGTMSAAQLERALVKGCGA